MLLATAHLKCALNVTRGLLLPFRPFYIALSCVFRLQTLPCSSDCLSAGVLVTCRLPEKEVRFLELLRQVSLSFVGNCTWIAYQHGLFDSIHVG